ncbi:MAG: AmmeMemoRadiSam system protein B [Candidatus Freyarchaeota archaeon]|nr:AmmeMemoRadiSam system protein B [Candidatus Jordarchaeia archaeon]
MERMPAAIGFYPGNPEELRRTIESCFKDKHGPGRIPKVNDEGARLITGCIAPHAGYYYSGPVAAHLYSALAEDGRPECFVMMGPSHMGYPGASIVRRGVWALSFGKAVVDSELADAMMKHASILLDEPRAHAREHSLEVQLPFLQYLYSEVRFVPIAFGPTDYETCMEIGEGVAEAVEELGRDVVVLGSTDLTHYGPMYGYAPAGTSPMEKVLKWIYDTDGKILEKVREMDPGGLYILVHEEGLTMCGVNAIASMMVAAKKLGAKRAEILKYATSYDIRGGQDAIVGYLSATLTK